MAKELNEKQRTFCELVAKGEAPYKACIMAGYSEKYANCYSHKMLGRYKEIIEELKQEVKEVIKEEFKYTIKESFDYLCNIAHVRESIDSRAKPFKLRSIVWLRSCSTRWAKLPRCSM